MPFPAFLDACVLYPQHLNDTLLRLAAAETYRPLWSADVLDELRRNLLIRISRSAVDYRLGNMQQHFHDAEVTGYQSLLPTMTNDEKDRHVLAAAVRANAEVIVTFNVKHFPATALDPYDLVAVHPDDFLLDQLDLYPGITLQCLHQQVAGYRKEPTTVPDLMTFLATRTGLPKFASEVLRHLPSMDSNAP
ncbi:PIN domain-containing protein [Halopolyspora algeriensis]|uniref:PIN domain-containing protein n=1 Tax=Halopolyspora algeriensis TaxID=1500506 RepID=A0A368VQJ6_9ACTN|nr:PIN domain-containing protein [Halopolyspora algeriensis]RCW43295.1 PIN domain-containing protein [Halopolyspora algeriensis]TQM56354.1 PIN domain-containing protein [Halopolyspora algeriensis]